MSFNSLQGVCMTMLDNWGSVGCYQNLASCRGRNRFDIHGSPSRLFLPKIAMLGESADNLREAINSPGSFHLAPRLAIACFFNFVFASGLHVLDVVA